jgi:hypothetical protein
MRTGDRRCSLGKMRSDFSREGFALDYGRVSRDYLSLPYAPLEH